LSEALVVPGPTGSDQPLDLAGRILVVGTRLWAELRAMRALEAAGFETYGAEHLEPEAEGRDEPPLFELACVVRTDNSPAPGPRVALAVRRLDPRVAMVVVGNVAFHPFEDRALGQISLDRLTKRSLAVLPVELGRFLPVRPSGTPLPVLASVGSRT